VTRQQRTILKKEFSKRADDPTAMEIKEIVNEWVAEKAFCWPLAEWAIYSLWGLGKTG
jgi:hypothetical protein